MKTFGGGKSCCWGLMISIAIILLTCEKSIASDVASDEEAAIAVKEEDGGGGGDHHGHDHEDHHIHEDGEDVSLSGEVSSGSNEHEHHDHNPVARGHGESCGEGDDDDGGTCDTGAGLICVEEVGKCECDKNAGEVYSSELGKCEHAPPKVIQEVQDNSLEAESNSAEEEKSSKEKDEDECMQNDEETSPTTTTTTTQATVAISVKENSLEVEEKEEKEEEQKPEMAIQHRTEDDDEEKHVSSEEDSGSLGGGGICANVNCEESLGRYSKCDEETGECQCNDVEDLNRSLIVKDGKCVINRQINDPCSSHDECLTTIAGRAWCHMDVMTMKRFCQCEMFHYFDESVKECLPFASDGVFSPCKTDMQCTGFQVAITGHGLGPHARCSQEKGRCECKIGPDGQKAFLYENYCFYQLMPGEHCDIDRECEVSFPGQDVGCLEGQCMCRNGENITAVSCPSEEILGGSKRIDGAFGDEEMTEDSGSVLDNLKSAMGLDLSNFVFIMIIGAVVLLVVVILSVFVIRKRHRYTVVKTREPTEEPVTP